MSAAVDPKIAPPHRPACACGRKKSAPFTFCVGCQRVLDLAPLKREERVLNYADSLGPKYQRSLEILRQAGRLS